MKEENPYQSTGGKKKYLLAEIRQHIKLILDWLSLLCESGSRAASGYWGKVNHGKAYCRNTASEKGSFCFAIHNLQSIPMVN